MIINKSHKPKTSIMVLSTLLFVPVILYYLLLKEIAYVIDGKAENNRS